MRWSWWLAGALALTFTASAFADAYYASNAAEFVVPADELDAADVGEAAVHAGFLPLSESDPRIVAGREAPDKVYEIWELPSHRIASITLTRLHKNNSFLVTFVAKDPSRHNFPLSGDACKRWLRFSAAMRLEFGKRQSRFHFRDPQCTP